MKELDGMAKMSEHLNKMAHLTTPLDGIHGLVGPSSAFQAAAEKLNASAAIIHNESFSAMDVLNKSLSIDAGASKYIAVVCSSAKQIHELIKDPIGVAFKNLDISFKETFSEIDAFTKSLSIDSAIAKHLTVSSAAEKQFSELSELMQKSVIDMPELKHAAIADFDLRKLAAVEVSPMRVLPELTPPLSDAAVVLNSLRDELDAQTAANASNPNIGVYVIATQSNGDEIRVEEAREVGASTIEITGVSLNTKEPRKVLAGVSTVALEVRVIDSGPKPPHLTIVKNDQ